MTQIIGLTSHTYEGATVRTSSDSSGNPLFVAKDVCEILGISKHRDAISRVPDWAQGRPVRVDTLGGAQDTPTLTEAGVYFLTLRSDKPSAIAFQKWVCTEVLPSIRKQGFYALAGSAARNNRRRFSTRLRAEAEALELMARGLSAPVEAVPEGYAAVLDWLAAQGLEPTDRARAQVINRLRRGTRSLAQRVLRGDKAGRGRTRVRRLWPIAALEQAARAAGLLPALAGEKGGA